MPVTLKQLAQELGLDYSTVSYALSGKGSINEATRQRVKEAAQRLGYVPNGLARRMRAGKTHNIGLVMPDSILVYNEVIQQLYHAAYERGYEVQIALTEFEAAAEERAIRSLLEQQVDGLIVHCSAESWSWLPQNASLRRAASQGIPTVIFSRAMEGSPFQSVLLSEKRKSHLAAKHLLELGHTQFALLLPVEGTIYAAHRSAVRGALEALAERGLPANALQIVQLGASDEGLKAPSGYGEYLSEILPRTAINKGRILMKQALESCPNATGILCYNDVIAIGAIQEAQARGIAIPDELAFVCSNRSLITELSPVSLTTSDHPAEDTVRVTLELLLDAIAGRATPGEQRWVDPVLHIGQSTVKQTQIMPQGQTKVVSPQDILDAV